MVGWLLDRAKLESLIWVWRVVGPPYTTELKATGPGQPPDTALLPASMWVCPRGAPFQPHSWHCVPGGWRAWESIIQQFRSLSSMVTVRELAGVLVGLWELTVPSYQWKVGGQRVNGVLRRGCNTEYWPFCPLSILTEYGYVICKTWYDWRNLSQESFLWMAWIERKSTNCYPDMSMHCVGELQDQINAHRTGSTVDLDVASVLTCCLGGCNTRSDVFS